MEDYKRKQETKEDEDDSEIRNEEGILTTENVLRDQLSVTSKIQSL